MKAIVLADGDAPDRAALDRAWPGWDEVAEVVVAADGGARHAGRLGLTILTWVGDGDSIDPDDLALLAERGVSIQRVPAAKDESDTELAVLEALAHTPDEILILGALGGLRIDHTIANIGLLAMPQLGDLPTTLLDERARIRLIRAPGPGGAEVRFPLPGKAGDRVSLLPYGDGVAGVTTHGLAYPLADEPLPPGPARGLSNVRVSEDAAVVVRSGRLLVIETPATLVE
jgi:thiamine pyrophosphokinase